MEARISEASYSPRAKKYGRVPAIVKGQLEVPENFIEKGEADVIALGKGTLVSGSIKSIMESY
ncbi:hypothetical protein [Peribacillus simplex]|uniref:hypothetical protein n=1 Tax=Peribacillus simplex TaxID=1478 RepID=UPI0021AAA516|nr:hypothetical protein [Peribacillus simplex]